MIYQGISVVSPAYNEASNIKLFCVKTNKVLKKFTSDYEIIIIDDGSTDNSLALLQTIKKQIKAIKIIRLRRRSGQTAALIAGINLASKDIVVVLDSDLQQDPNDIPKLVDPILIGKADVVSGQRLQRQHSIIYRIIARVEYWLNRWFLGIKLHDTAVSPNAYKREILKDLDLYGEMHRFLVPILHWRGYRVVEIPVTHLPRIHGQSKYSPYKAIRGFLDLIIVKFWQDFSVRPIHFFGSIGLLLLSIGLLIGIEEAIRKLFFHLSIYNRTLPLLAAFLAIIGVQFLIFGILADILIKIYYKDKTNDNIDKIIK